VSYLRKVRYTVLNGTPVDDVYGYIQYLTSAPVQDGTGKTSQHIIGVYDINGIALPDVSNTFWETLPLYAHIWNDGDFENAVNTFREAIE